MYWDFKKNILFKNNTVTMSEIAIQESSDSVDS